MTHFVTVFQALRVFVLVTLRTHSIPHCKLYRDPGKEKVIADCVIAFIFKRYCLFLMFY